MREVILTVGPRASGKSEFCQKAIQIDPSITLVSRDELLIKLFGTTSLNPYAGDHYLAEAEMWKIVEKRLKFGSELKILLDAWNGSSRERLAITRMLRDLGADKIKAWYFVTQPECVNQWFWQKPGIAKMSEMRSHLGKKYVFYDDDAPRRDYKLFHQLALEIDSDGFDEVTKIDPVITLPEHVLVNQLRLF